MVSAVCDTSYVLCALLWDTESGNLIIRCMRALDLLYKVKSTWTAFKTSVRHSTKWTSFHILYAGIDILVLNIGRVLLHWSVRASLLFGIYWSAQERGEWIDALQICWHHHIPLHRCAP